MFPHTEVSVPGHDDMIEDLNPDRGAGALQPPGDLLIIGTGVETAARMIVGEDQTGGVVFQCRGDYFPGMDRRPVNRPLEELFRLDNLIGVIQIYDLEDLFGQSSQ